MEKYKILVDDEWIEVEKQNDPSVKEDFYIDVFGNTYFEFEISDIGLI